ncbi:MAG: hypothetical protein K0S55_419 [Clostridia bacterium]|jgi:hypothetical protein|nr:hypothetical protein [Clostridia bacterium]
MNKKLLKSIYESGIKVNRVEISYDEYKLLKAKEPEGVSEDLDIENGMSKTRYYTFEDVESLSELDIELKIKQYEAICKTRDFTKYIFIMILISFISSIIAGLVFILPLLR